MPACSIIPVLAYEDVNKTIDWLCNTFGFKERWRVGNHRAQLSFGEGAIAISSQRLDQEPVGQSLMLRVDDVDAHYQHVLSCGVQVAHPPADFPYGERQYSVTDIGGHHWTFSQSIADLAPEDWGGVTAK